MPQKILVVDDDVTLQETIAYNLRKQGYEVLVAGDGSEAIRIARESQPDLILLDLMLPRVDGIEVCRVVRQEMNVPIVMLTARDEEIDRVVGLEVGADDYVTKPFSMRELVARVKAHLRRERLVRETITAESEAQDQAVPHQVLAFGDLSIDIGRREVKRGGAVVTLKPKELELLIFLARHRGMVLSRDLILERVWGWTFSGGSRTVDVHIRWLREKLEPDPAKPQRIVTLRGIGYRFEG
jgi:DNA-binding response OmpR family regulator